MPRVGDSGSGGAGCGLRTGAGGAAEGGGSTAAGEQAGGWAARLGYGRERARFGLNVLYFAFFHIYVWYILCIENFFSKIMGIQLNTIEFMWARPCSWAAVGPPGGRHDQLDFFPSSLDNFRICRFRGKFLKRGVKEVIRSNSSGNKGLVLSI